jgi:hypothetical protein
VRAAFTFKDRIGAITNLYDGPTFANAQEQQCDDFGRVRGIANAAKHLQLSNVRQVPNAPSHAANTTSSSRAMFRLGRRLIALPSSERPLSQIKP